MIYDETTLILLVTAVAFLVFAALYAAIFYLFRFSLQFLFKFFLYLEKRFIGDKHKVRASLLKPIETSMPEPVSLDDDKCTPETLCDQKQEKNKRPFPWLVLAIGFILGAWLW